MKVTAEHKRLAGARDAGEPWRRFGPYLSERQWGTVREDYSAGGTAWDAVTHDASRSRAYRWGEDGLAGFSDDQQRLCLGLGLWNGADAILKERLFGLSGSEGNHGEDVKEIYYYLDALPTHAYLRMLYKYPHAAFPYDALVGTSRSRNEPEFELIDTGVFDEDRYFDVSVEYAKADPEDILMRVRVTNRALVDAPIWILPQLWCRNTWSWEPGSERPVLTARGTDRVDVAHPTFGTFTLHCDGPDQLLACDNDTNHRRLHGVDGVPGYWKDGLHEYIVNGRMEAINPARVGTKIGVLWHRHVPAGATLDVRLRLARTDLHAPFAAFDAVIAARQAEADAFYDSVHPASLSSAERKVQRQALAGMLWSQQCYRLDVARWLRGDAGQPEPPRARLKGRNAGWTHLNNADVISMPDKWEYPWYAAWDLAFHAVPLALVDVDFAKAQLLLLTREWYMHPNGQLPAYEWAFGDVNPPVHAWAAWRVFEIDRAR
ncbi:MAG: glucosidase, partial [Vicinamibacterales bacterium]